MFTPLVLLPPLLPPVFPDVLPPVLEEAALTVIATSSVVVREPSVTDRRTTYEPALKNVAVVDKD